MFILFRTKFFADTSNDAIATKEQFSKTVNQVAKVAALGSTFFFKFSAQARDKPVWKKIDLPVQETLFDVSFDPSNPEHGWLVGARVSFKSI
jgi:hypothetical protein